MEMNDSALKAFSEGRKSYEEWKGLMIFSDGITSLDCFDYANCPATHPEDHAH